MPRWRDDPNYRPSRGREPGEILAHAIKHPVYREGQQTYKVVANERLIALYAGKHHVLRVSELNEALMAVEPKSGAPQGSQSGRWTPEFKALMLGDLIGRGIQLGVVEEVEADGERAFRIVDRQMRWRVINGRVKQIRGLTPAKQVIMDRKWRRSTRPRPRGGPGTRTKSRQRSASTSTQ